MIINDLMKRNNSELSRRDHILSEAAKIIKAQGYAGATMREIAGAVGVEVSSLYNHIQSKQEILYAICFTIGQEYIEGLDKVLMSGLSYKKQLKAIIHLHITLAAKHLASMQVFEEEWKHLKDDELERFKEMRQNYENKLLVFFQQGIESRKFQSLDPKILLYNFLSSLKWLNFYFKENKKLDINILCDDINKLTLNGILK